MRIGIMMVLLALAGCNSITFVQYEQPGEQPQSRHWHHGTLNGLVEISAPLNLQQVCGGKAWNTVKTEATVWNVLVASLIPTVGVSLYTPWTNEVECFSASDSAPPAEKSMDKDG